MNIQTIKKLQAEHGATELQDLINSGTAWKPEGFTGRSAMDALRSGACMLPTEAHYDYYGNKVPARTELKAGTKGTFQNSKRFYTELEGGE